jgi:hypothetical protein
MTAHQESEAFMTKDSAFDLDAARLNPAGTFATPAEVVADPRLDRAAKLEVLRQWERDARELDVASDENMAGGEPSMLSRVKSALDALGAAKSAGTAPTAKHGG